MKTTLKDLVSRLVEEILDEAVRRQDYVQRLADAAKGAMGEHFKARYAELNATKRRRGNLGTVEGWDREANNLLNFRFADAADRTFKGDPDLAFEEAMAEVRRGVPRYLRMARDHVAEAFGLDPAAMDDPPDEATDEFFARLRNVFDEARR